MIYVGYFLVGWFVLIKKSTHFSFGGKFIIGIFHMYAIYLYTYLQESFKSLGLEFRDAKTAEMDSSIILPAKSAVCWEWKL